MTAAEDSTHWYPTAAAGRSLRIAPSAARVGSAG